ncbi:MAG: metallophosphoesterase [Candidatus Peregrinibacteria bacterium]|nr:metallophosphoesterase [Candidatus Peregrinibacteria bacterium]
MKKSTLIFLIVPVLVLLFFCLKEETPIDSGQPSSADRSCKLVMVGHFYSLQKYPDLQEIFINEMNEKHSDADALVLMGDNTILGNKQELINLFAVLAKIKTQKFFAPGNHDLRSPASYNAWLQMVGYTSAQKKINNCNLVFLNTINPQLLDFNDVEMVKGGGLDEQSISLLENLEKKDGETNLVFMHHALHSIGLIHPNDEWNDELNRIYENEKTWREKIQPIIKNKVDTVFVGDLANASMSRIEIDGIPYIGNSMSCGFDPNPTTSRQPISYLVIEVVDGKVNVKIDYLPIPITSDWFKFDRNHRYEVFKDEYNDEYDRKKYKYPN